MSDGYFDDFDELDSAFLHEVDAIEASQLHQSYLTPTAVSPPKPKTGPPKPQPKAPSSDEFDMTFDVDADELERLDEFIADSYEGKARPVAGPSLTRQTTLDGKVLPMDNSKQAPRSFSKTKSSSNNPFGKNQKTKKWDHTAFSETGWISTKKARGKATGKGKAKEAGEDEDDDDDEDDDAPLQFEQFPAPFVSVGPPPPMSLKADLLAARNWIYPLNRPRRDYQFNIAKKCLFQNTLVALPTGLGKTFIAGVVMLNYYKWFPECRIVFLAPTKPLVAQQIEACHQVCGIPGSDAAELTGQTKPSKRSVAWAEKRVMYMTPQTLVQDFQTGIVDPKDIVLIVFDEAHRGTGDYAYAQIMRYMMAKNPNFRVLALTATPGNNAEAVQSIVDSLHISHIEIRNEESQDLRRYVLKKVVDTHIIQMSDSLNRVTSLLSKVIEPLLNKVRNSGLVHQQSPIMLHHYACQSAYTVLHKRKDLGWAWGYLKVLGSLARAMAYLMETSIRSCYRHLIELQDSLSTSSKQSDKTMLKLMKDDKNWIALLAELEKQKAHGFDPHPKMEKLISLALKHFVEADADAAAAIERGETVEGESKVMVFVQFRDCVDEIIDRLKHHHPLIRPTPFIGQGTDKRGRKGISQKEQLETIEKFKAGEFNVLVSTSIGEEGLDIGEIDEIICYDAQKSSVRMLQRVGRTGRKRVGKVDVLLAEQREERNWQKSKDNYEDVQYTIINGNQLELYDDVERLLPGSPECLQIEMPIEAYSRMPAKEKKTKEAPAKKRKRNDDINRNIPLGALTGFVTASELRPKAKKKTAKTLGVSDVDSDSDDADIAAGLGGTTSTKKTKKSQSRAVGSSKATKTGKATKASQAKLDLFLIPERLEDDDDDLDIQIGLQDIMNTPSKARSKAKISDSDLEISPIQLAKARPKLATESDDDPSPRPLAKAKGRKKKAARPVPSVDNEPSKKANPSWLLEGSSEGEDEGKSKPPRPDSLGTKNSSTPFKSTAIFKSAKTRLEQSQTTDTLKARMPAAGLATTSSEIPRPTFPIRAPMKGRRVQLPSSSPQEDDEQPAPRRLVRRRSPSPIDVETKISNKKRKVKLAANPAMFDMEAIHSGDEESEGSSDVDMVESESDRQFLQEPGQTQVPLSYNQTAAYRMGLMTQVPGHHLDGPRFSTKAKRVGRFAGGRTQLPSRPALDSSPQRSDVPDEYHMGSFVVNDEEPIIYSNSSEP